VTSPYKKTVISFIDELDKTALDTGAVNTIKVQHIGNSILLKGYNTDIYGFDKAYGKIISENGGPVLILGSGGAADSISYILKKRNIKFKKVSRTASNPELLTYKKINAGTLKNFNIIINATPIGMFPKLDEFPSIPYAGIKKEHILIDLIYKPEETIFLKMGRIQQAETYNGEPMLIEQASYAWQIWNNGK
jgi:shikimate dehydrogenase